MSGQQPAYKRSTLPTIRIDDGAGALAALTHEAATRLRKKAWAHLERINPQTALKAWEQAKTR